MSGGNARMSDQGRQRLNSWKEISTYLGRDVRTVSRWERERGLPVHRLPGGRGSSVFAFTDEIDRWQDLAAAELPAPAAAAPAVRWLRHPGMRAAGLAILVAGTALGVAAFWPPGDRVVALQARAAQLVAIGAHGREVWSHTFDSPINITHPYQRTAIADIDGDAAPEVLASVGTVGPGGNLDPLYAFSSGGRLLWRRELDDVVTFGAGRFGPPWNTGPIVVQRGAPSARIVWATHHHTWWPAIVARFDARGAVLDRFVHPGWITSMIEGPGDTLLLGGVHNAADADVLAVLDARSWPGTAPSGPGLDAAPYECRGCPTGRPLRYFVLPRSELNVVVNAPRQHAYIKAFDAGVEIRIQQAPTDVLAGEAIFELSTDLRPVRARMSDSYWTWHRRLEREGKIAHPTANCPDRRGLTVRQWDRGIGWSTVFIPASDL